jgi:hypothetical protein
VVLLCSQTCRHCRSVSSAIMSLPHKGSDATMVYTHLDRKSNGWICPRTSVRRSSGEIAPAQASIHRLLETDPRTGSFRRNEDAPLDCDLLVVDETSMVDVPLMRAVFRALPARAALVLVGDVDQLPSEKMFESVRGAASAAEAPATPTSRPPGTGVRRPAPRPSSSGRAMSWTRGRIGSQQTRHWREADSNSRFRRKRRGRSVVHHPSTRDPTSRFCLFAE